MGHCRESLQRRKFSISIALKRVFILGRFNEADFAQNVDFVGAITGSWKGFARGGKVCGEESIDSQFPDVKSVRKKKENSEENFFSSKAERQESGERKSRRGKLKASIGTVKSMCNVIQFTTVRRGRTELYLLLSFASSWYSRIFGLKNAQTLEKSDFGAFRYKNFHAHGRSERSQPNCFAFRSFLSHFRSRGEFSPVSVCCVWLFIHSQRVESLSNSEGNVYPTSEQVPVVFLGFRNSWVQSGWRDGKGNKKKDRKNRRRTRT